MLRAGHGLILIVLALLTLGVVMVSSAGLAIDADQSITLADIVAGRPALLAALAVAAMVAASRLPVERICLARGLRSPILWILVTVTVLLLAVHAPVIGKEVHGARRWIDLGFVSFQPSELAKWGMVAVVAWYATRHASVMGRCSRGVVGPMAVVFGSCALVAAEDLGTAILIATTSLAILLAGGLKLWHAMVAAPAAAAGLVVAVLASPYRIDRLRAFIDPFADPQGTGYQVIQSLAAVAGGGLAGRGLGNGVHKFGYLPHDTTDFIFAIICEELGLLGAAAVLCLYGGLLLCGLSIVRRASNPFAALLGLGIVLTIGLQALMNLAVVTGVVPPKGIALPLISAGGTGWVLTAFCVGLLVSMEQGKRHQGIKASRDLRSALLPKPSCPDSLTP